MAPCMIRTSQTCCYTAVSAALSCALRCPPTATIDASGRVTEGSVSLLLATTPFAACLSDVHRYLTNVQVLLRMRGIIATLEP